MTSETKARPHLSARIWLALAAIAAFVSLGLGWAAYSRPTLGLQLFLSPGSTVFLSDGTVEFTPGSLQFYPTLSYDSGVLPGYATDARVLLAAAAALLIVAVRRRSEYLARTGLAVAALAPLLSGRLTQGSAVLLVGMGCAAIALQSMDVLNLTPGRDRGTTT